MGISIGVAFQRKIGVGLFGGEGFIMQKLEGTVSPSCTRGAPSSKRTFSREKRCFSTRAALSP
jgi:hypothetical protein